MLRRHFDRLHLNHRVKVGPFICLICRCGCADSVFLRSHYHCPICPYVTQKVRVGQHFKQHFFNASNLEEFKMSMETVKKPFSICINPNQGLFLVPKTDNEPTHVIRNPDNAKGDKCSEALCQLAMSKAKKNGKSDLKCKHILRANEKALKHVQNTTIFTDILNSKFVRDVEGEKCFYLIKEALWKEVFPIVSWNPLSKKNIIFYSVFCNASYGTFGRIIVKYDSTMDSYHCNCPLDSDGGLCPYAKLCELYRKFSEPGK